MVTGIEDVERTIFVVTTRSYTALAPGAAV
jgi:hypothetical protein